MHRPVDKWNAARSRGFSDQFTPIVAINGIIVLALLVLALSVPSAPEWISAAAQAEFVGPDGTASAPTQIAQPLDQMRLVRSE